MEPHLDPEDWLEEQPTRPMPPIPTPGPPSRARRVEWLKVAGYVGPLVVGLVGLTCAIALMGWLLLRPRAPEAASPSIPTATTTLQPRLMVTTLPTPTQFVVDEDWSRLAPGVERRNMLVPIYDLDAEAPVRLVRLDPSQVRLRVHYTPGVWLYMHEWHTRMGGLVIVNGGFFDSDGSPTGLLISDGVKYGETYRGTGGMFGVTDGQFWLRALAQVPYSSSEPVEQAVQGWPVLVYPGGSPADIADNGSRSRRTAIGIDAEGRVMLIVVDEPMFTLIELADWLASSDLGLVSALNLDGGGSTGLVVDAGEEYTVIDSLGPLPAVIAAYPIE